MAAVGIPCGRRGNPYHNPSGWHETASEQNPIYYATPCGGNRLDKHPDFPVCYCSSSPAPEHEVGRSAREKGVYAPAPHQSPRAILGGRVWRRLRRESEEGNLSRFRRPAFEPVDERECERQAPVLTLTDRRSARAGARSGHAA